MVLDRVNLEEAFKTGIVQARISKAFIQGPARAGKTSLKCLLTSQRYVSHESTGCMEPPQIAIHKFGSSDGKYWTPVSDDEMLDEAVRLNENKTNIETTSEEEEEDTTNATAITTDDSTILSAEQPINDERPLLNPQDEPVTSNDEPIKKPLPNAVARKIMKEAKAKMSGIIDSVHADPSKPLHKDWLYFIDSGGQIQYQQLLHAFLPCASLLLLVMNLAEDQPSNEMVCKDGVTRRTSEYSPSNEEVFEQLILMVGSCSQKLRIAIESDAFLKKIIKLPERLHVMAVATHLDDHATKCESEGKSAEQSVCEKQERFHKILDSFDGLICPNIRNQESFYKVNGLKAKEEDGFKDEVVQTISDQLRKQAFEVEIPLRWYAFELLLRKTAESFHGILTLDFCKMIGNELKMTNSDVESALKFFHLLNTMLYYPNESLDAVDTGSDIVFVHPSYLFNIITELIILICKARAKESIEGHAAIIIKRAHRAIFPKEFICITETGKAVMEHISDFNSELLSLFEHLLIAKKVKLDGIDMFFIPALLPLTDPSIAMMNSKSASNSPYVLLFKKMAPIGFFSTFIIHLLSSGEPNDDDWMIPPDDIPIYSNCIILRWHVTCDVHFIEYRDRYEVYCSIAEHRPEIRKELEKAINDLIPVKEEQPFLALYCPGDKCERPCFAKIVNPLASKEDAVVQCSSQVLVEYNDKRSHSCWSWFPSCQSLTHVDVDEGE